MTNSNQNNDNNKGKEKLDKYLNFARELKNDETVLMLLVCFE